MVLIYPHKTIKQIKYMHLLDVMWSKLQILRSSIVSTVKSMIGIKDGQRERQTAARTKTWTTDGRTHTRTDSAGDDAYRCHTLD